MKLSVLDQSPAAKGSTPADAITASLALARACDRLGYERYWLSEHHNSSSIVGSAPEVLMAAVAATTRRIRVGSAGIMLPHYAALKVAEQFRVLEAIAPGRIDLGLGRAPGSDRLTARALNPHASPSADDFPRQIADLQRWLDGERLPEGHPYRAITAQPQGPTSPEMWILGSSGYGAQLAAHLGLPYAFAYFFSDGLGVEQALDLYRQNYRPSERFPSARPTICVWALAADSTAEAERQLMTREHWRVRFEQGLLGPLVAPDEAAAYAFSPAEQARIDQLRVNALVGTGPEVAAQIRALAASLGLDHIVVNTWAHDPQVRLHSYRLLAREFHLQQEA
ncbi:LLM class flavin-dependent oxidoreductase [Massilia sp. PAMC28688]|uniref:LLM class flavin-dependent oxidoreductase n=1 Tax=Massilia sp. PAMC28688 TaxID=2861283 RepID=UPI001C62676A|nr:LLM class flavin-dependent oxidoreductase [Massilia sp. PAMC28688]QYF93811.1 LLM class flavin-dependent oxidoreductase [Massilia sp. PAMC28688]